MAGVSTDEGTGLKGKADGHIIPVLVKAIQELTARLEALEGA